MTTINESNFRREYAVIRELIMRVHQVPKETFKTLEENKDVKDFCVMTRHFMSIDDDAYKVTFYIDYEAFHWYVPLGASIELGDIILYDNFIEYQKERMARITEGAALN